MLQSNVSSMRSDAPAPLFTLRGHHAGVTALACCSHQESSYLFSGDEEGDVIIWDLSIFRKTTSYKSVIPSRIQSLKVVSLDVDKQESKVLIIQSRNDGIRLVTLDFDSKEISQPRIIATFPTYDLLFSTGDAREVETKKALLAYPSCIENYLVTIRLIGDDAKTLASGSASRWTSEQKHCPIFNIRITENSAGYSLFVAYEDGCICTFTFNTSSFVSVPVLNADGLKVDLINTINLGFGDFVSAFDVIKCNTTGIFIAVCGSPLNNLVFLSDPENSGTLENVKLKRPGVSAITIRPDQRLVAVSGWDRKVRLYSVKSRKLLASFAHHIGIVQNILFVDKPSSNSGLNIHENSGLDIKKSNGNQEKGRYWLCCASMEGTISISEVY